MIWRDFVKSGKCDKPAARATAKPIAHTGKARDGQSATCKACSKWR